MHAEGNSKMTQDAVGRAAWMQDILERYEGPLIRYAFRLTHDIELARDIVQDTFLQVCRADRERIDGHLAPWLYRVCRNRALDVIKKEQRMQRMDVQEVDTRPSPGLAPGEAASGRETEQILLDALAQLPAKQQEVFRLKFQDQLSYKEISEVTGFPTNNVRYLLHTSLKTLRQQLHGRLRTADGL